MAKFILAVFSAMLTAALSVSGLSTGAAAEEVPRICIRCEGPARTYVCEVQGASVENTRSLGLYCILNAAQLQGHDQCSVSKSSSSTCTGDVISLYYSGPAFPQTRGIADQNAGAPGPDQGSASSEDEAGKSPKTLVELTNSTVEASKKGLNKVGKNTGIVIKKTGKAIGAAGKKAADTLSDAGNAAGKAAKKTGTTLKNAASNTYRCLTSLFKKCGSGN